MYIFGAFIYGLELRRLSHTRFVIPLFSSPNFSARPIFLLEKLAFLPEKERLSSGSG